MELVASAVSAAARAWDDQHLGLAAAAGQLAGAPTSGFTSAVAGAAARFTSAWQRHTAQLAVDAEARADGLRSTMADFLRTDEAVGLRLRVLQAHLVEHR